MSERCSGSFWWDDAAGQFCTDLASNIDDKRMAALCIGIPPACVSMAHADARASQLPKVIRAAMPGFGHGSIIPAGPVSAVPTPAPPPFNSTFYWQLQGVIPEHPAGDVVDIDGFDNSAATFARLKGLGKYTIAYFSAGTWERWRPDAGRFPADVLAKPVAGWAGEKWLDVTRLDVLRPIMEARADLARERGADAIEWDNVDVVANAAQAGISVTAAQQRAYNAMLADIAHARGLAAIYKNATLAEWAADHFDGAILESGYQHGEVSAMSGFYTNGKPVWDVEYTAAHFAHHCADARSKRIFLVQLNRSLDGKAPINTCRPAR